MEPLLLLLRAIWLLLIFTMLFSLLPSPFQPLLLPIFSRGKLIKPSSSYHRFTVPHRFFLHFYIAGTVFNGLVLLMMLTHILVITVPNFEISSQEAWRVVILLALFQMQVLRRLYETASVSKFGRHARMHILAYFLGPLFYVMASLSLFPRAIELMVKFSHNYSAYIHGTYKSAETAFQRGNFILELGWRYWIAGALFVLGWVHQYRCHAILASLRTSPKEDAQYKIPYGDWFEYVSSAHYLAEFVIYFSFIVATGGQSVDTWLLFAFTVLNLSIAANDTHKWYREKFEDYPPSRKAIIPFVY